MMEEHGIDPGVPFSFFVSLLHEISKVPAREKRNPASDSKATLQIFKKWIKELQRKYSHLPPGSLATIFCLLFPEEDTRRKYNMQETKLAEELAKCLGISLDGRGESLKKWNGENTLGCLGSEVKKLLDEASASNICQTSPLSIAGVNELLDELASTSAFSDKTVRTTHAIFSRRSRQAILRDLFCSISALEASFLTQIILKDLRPILYPLAETHYTAALTKYNTKSIEVLNKEAAMRAWDPSGQMLKMYKVRADLYTSANAFEMQTSDFIVTPQIGIPIEIPKSVKGRGCLDSLKPFARCKKVWAETKYDGERAQIHVEVREDGSSYITIFSKSKRDSTLDRYGVHGIIREALGLTKHALPFGTPPGKSKKNVILDAEMVSFSESTNKIDEFWRIRSLIASTARGPRSSVFIAPRTKTGNLNRSFSQASMVSNASDDCTRHLAIVFFDVLVLDSASLLSSPYSYRRSVLASLIKLTPGYAMLSERTQVTLNGPRGVHGAAAQLRTIWAKKIAECEEGLVLKADDGGYNDFHSPWVKLKKDYIQGYGDTVDLVVVAASWEKDRARELRVAPSAYTTFYVGALSNNDALKMDPNMRPNFEIYFTVSYGLNRDELEEANFLIKSSEPIKFNAKKQIPKGLPYTYSLYSGLSPPAVIFREPLLIELCGASFTKAPECKFYELRFPRTIKLYRPSSRSWSSGITLQELQKIARESIGRDRPGKETDDWAKELWGQTASPTVQCSKKRKEREVEWTEKLAVVDGLGDTKNKKIKGLDFSSASSNERKETEVSKDTKGSNGRQALALKPLGLVFNVGQPLPSSSPARRLLRPTIQDKEDIPIVLHASHQGRQAIKLGRSYAEHVSPFGTRPCQASSTAHLPVEDHNQPLYFERELISTLTPLARQMKPQLPTPPPSAEVKSPNPSKSIVEFLKDTLVWFAQPCNAPRASWRLPTKQLISKYSRIHCLESMLIGCGWHTQGVASKKSRYGVIFVDESNPSGEKWKGYTLGILEEKYKSLQSGTGYLPIWIFDVRLLGIDTLGEVQGDIRALALGKFE